ncbi:MAG: hypothetical protein Q4G04_01800 [bacterium]|nr:hypothetical protein [bacterium]
MNNTENNTNTPLDEPVMTYRATGNLNTALSSPQMKVGNVTDVNISAGEINNSMGAGELLQPVMPASPATDVKNISNTSSIPVAQMAEDDRLKTVEVAEKTKAVEPTNIALVPGDKKKDEVEIPDIVKDVPVIKKSFALTGDAQIVILIIIIIFVFILILPIINQFINNFK